MTSAVLLRKGWCPGARRPMPAKDGLLVRLRISGGAVAAPVLRAIAQAGRAYGNGLFDLSARGNLQIRGIHEGSLPALIEMLDGLDLLDEDRESEAVRNVLVSPLAGLDGRNEVFETAKALEARLAANRDLHALPGKFGFLIDDGSALSLASIAADIRFDWITSAQSFAIGLGGCANKAVFVGCCERASIPSIAARLAMAFLSLRSSLEEPPRRMRELLACCGATAIAEAARLGLGGRARPGAVEEPCPIGWMRFSEVTGFGAGAAFGSLDANMLEGAARAAEIFGAGEIRLTPWRALIVPHVREEQAGAISALFAEHGFITDRTDPRLAVAACGGASTCERGTTDPRSDALSLMSLARQIWKSGIALHVSGCAKGCARHAITPLTLIAREGLYDVMGDEAAQRAGIGDAPQLGLPIVRKMLEAAAQRNRQNGALTRQ